MQGRELPRRRLRRSALSAGAPTAGPGWPTLAPLVVGDNRLGGEPVPPLERGCTSFERDHHPRCLAALRPLWPP